MDVEFKVGAYLKSSILVALTKGFCNTKNLEVLGIEFGLRCQHIETLNTNNASNANTISGTNDVANEATHVNIVGSLWLDVLKSRYPKTTFETVCSIRRSLKGLQ